MWTERRRMWSYAAIQIVANELVLMKSMAIVAGVAVFMQEATTLDEEELCRRVEQTCRAGVRRMKTYQLVSGKSRRKVPGQLPPLRRPS